MHLTEVWVWQSQTVRIKKEKERKKKILAPYISVCLYCKLLLRMNRFSLKIGAIGVFALYKRWSTVWNATPLNIENMPKSRVTMHGPFGNFLPSASIAQAQTICLSPSPHTDLFEWSSIELHDLQASLIRIMKIPTQWPVRPAKTQISPVWSESSLRALRVAKDPVFLDADSEFPD